MKRCSRCLLPDSYPAITFDGEGVCSICADYVPKPLLGAESLQELLRSAKGEGYDCLIGISGGKDSCYVAFLAKRELGMRPLCVCYEFPFLTALARQNARTVCEKLGIDLIMVRTKGNIEYPLIRRHFRSLAATGTTWGQCLFCHYGIDAILYTEAHARNIPFILGGVTKYEQWSIESRLNLVFRRIRGLPLRDKSRFAFNQACAFLRLVQQRRQFRIPGASVFDVYAKAKLPQTGPRHINIFDYMEWDQDRIEEILTREAGWLRPEKTLSWRYDCILEPLLDLTYKKEFGVSATGIYLSNMVRDGKMERSRALRILEEAENGDYLARSLCSALEFLGLPEAMAEHILIS